VILFTGEALREPLLGDQDSDDEAEDEDAEVSSASEVTDRSLRYLCHSPSPVDGRDIDESSTMLAWRFLKRIKTRQEQRLVTKAAMELTSSEGTCPRVPLSLDSVSSKMKDLRMQVMEPSVFVYDNSDGWTVVRPRRWPPEIDTAGVDPNFKEISNFLVLGRQSFGIGQIILWFGAAHRLRCGSSRTQSD
jgi:hypothetical protein